MIGDLIRAFVEAVVVRGMVGTYPLPTDWSGRLRMTYAGDIVLESGAIMKSIDRVTLDVTYEVP